MYFELSRVFGYQLGIQKLLKDSVKSWFNTVTLNVIGATPCISHLK